LNDTYKQYDNLTSLPFLFLKQGKQARTLKRILTTNTGKFVANMPRLEAVVMTTTYALPTLVYCMVK